jgi:hypothetical protein
VRRPSPSTPTRRRLSAGLGVALAAVGAGLATAPGAVAAPQPSLRLVGPVGSPRVHLVAGRAPLDFGMLVAATGGDVEVRVRRIDWDTPMDAWEADGRTGLFLQQLPVGNLNGFAGFRRFLHITVATRTGRRVADLYRPFCPNSTARIRVAAAGPVLARYPTVCEATYSPFTRGMVWGIEEGWATPAYVPRSSHREFRRWSVKLRPGTYEVTYEITPFFRTFFRVAPEDAVATATVRVRRAGSGRPSRPAPPAHALARRAAGASTVPIDLSPDPDTLPDLSALPAWGISVRRSKGRDLLGFASTSWNAGPAPMIVEGFRQGAAPTMDADQYFYDEAGAAVGRAPVGDFRYDARHGHHHWHFLQFVRYSIVDAATSEVVRSHKQSFCLAPSDSIDLTVPRAVFRPYLPELASTCGTESARWLREALPAGWGDTYFQNVAGQAFDITSVPNGTYRIRVAMNPLGLLYEVSTANNVEDRTIELRGRKGARRVAVEPWHGMAG